MSEWDPMRTRSALRMGFHPSRSRGFSVLKARRRSKSERALAVAAIDQRSGACDSCCKPDVAESQAREDSRWLSQTTRLLFSCSDCRNPLLMGPARLGARSGARASTGNINITQTQCSWAALKIVTETSHYGKLGHMAWEFSSSSLREAEQSTTQAR